MRFAIKRIYEPASPKDGVRILVDRLWPRGIKKADARLSHWLKDLAPSPGLRVWFGHKPERFREFRERYKAELNGNPALAELAKLGAKVPVTLLYAAHDPAINHAVVLQSVLRSTSDEKGKRRRREQ
jgi:uncharacterized protein YeaO (DUF488 family)